MQKQITLNFSIKAKKKILVKKQVITVSHCLGYSISYIYFFHIVRAYSAL